MTVSDRQHDAFDNPAKALCRAGNLRVLREAASSATGNAQLFTTWGGNAGQC
jgi:hypothetical protein